MGMQHRFTVENCSTDHGQAAWASSMDKQHRQVVGTCSRCMSLQHVLAVYMSMLHAHVNAACPYYMTLKWKPTYPSCLFMQHGLAAWTSARTCSKDRQQGHAGFHYKNMQHWHEHAAWTSIQLRHATRSCSMDIQHRHGHTARTWSLGMQQGHVACSMDMQHLHASLTCNRNMHQGCAA